MLYTKVCRLWVCSLHIVTIPTGFCWLTCRKQKLVQNKILQQGLLGLISSFHFRQVFVHYFMSIFHDMQINRPLHLSSSLWEISLCCHLFKRKIDQKHFLAQQQMNCISYLMVCKIYFCSELPNIPEKLWQIRKRKSQSISIMLFKKRQKKRLDCKTYSDKLIISLATTWFLFESRKPLDNHCKEISIDKESVLILWHHIFNISLHVFV